jgi:hypothetical protein
MLGTVQETCVLAMRRDMVSVLVENCGFVEELTIT